MIAWNTWCMTHCYSTHRTVLVVVLLLQSSETCNLFLHKDDFIKKYKIMSIICRNMFNLKIGGIQIIA